MLFDCSSVLQSFVRFFFSVDNIINEICVFDIEQICGDAIDVLRAKVCLQPIEFGWVFFFGRDVWLRRHFGQNERQ